MDEYVTKYLYDVLAAVDEVLGYFEGRPKLFAEFSKDLMLRRAVERNVEIMGEGTLPPRTFHEHKKGIKEMFGIDIGCKKKGKDSVYYVKNPEVLKENKLGK